MNPLHCLPREHESEAALLTHVLSHPVEGASYLGRLPLDAFHHPHHRAIVTLIAGLARAGVSWDVDILSGELMKRATRADGTIDDAEKQVLSTCWELATRLTASTPAALAEHRQRLLAARDKRRLHELLSTSADYLLQDRATAEDIFARLEEIKRSSAAGAGLSEGLADCLISAGDLVTQRIAPRKRLLGKWLHECDLGYVFAGRGVGKTWLAMALPAAVSQGTPLGLWEAGEGRVPVLYVDGEMPLELTQSRSLGMNLADGAVTYLHHERVFDQLECSLNIGDAAHREAITALMIKKAFKVLILDNLSSLACGVSENKGEEYEPIAQWLLELRRRKLTVMVVHHAGRNLLMRGHSKREDACSWILELRDAKAEGEQGAKFISHFAKPSRNTGEPMPDLLWHFTTAPDGRVGIQCEEARAGEYEVFIKHVLDGAEKQQDIAEMMGKPKGTISKWAKKAIEEGRLKREGNRLLPTAAASGGSDDDENGSD
jgi:hypothetical protein